MKILIKTIFAVLILVTISCVLVIFFSIQLNLPPVDMPQVSFFKVENGNTASEIGNELKKQGLIKSSTYFKLYVSLKKTASDIKAGLYKIEAGLSMREIHEILILGSEELFEVVIPPGLTTRSIAQILEEREILQATTFLEEVERQEANGFLFPDTYSFPENYPAKKVVSFMLNNFYKNLKEVYPEYQNLDDESIFYKVIMASIIEKEYRMPEEASIIASVFYNRIEKNMYLQSCATVVYVITEEMGKKHPDRLYYRDLELKSEYNTYTNKGLPPGPICNPGRVAIDASFNPAETDYLFFLLENENSGKHSFSKSLAEHNKSYNLYIKGK